MLCGDDREVCGAILKGVPKGRIGPDGAVPVLPAPGLGIRHREATGHGHPALAARVVPCVFQRSALWLGRDFVTMMQAFLLAVACRMGP